MTDVTNTNKVIINFRGSEEGPDRLKAVFGRARDAIVKLSQDEGLALEIDEEHKLITLTGSFADNRMISKVQGAFNDIDELRVTSTTQEGDVHTWLTLYGEPRAHQDSLARAGHTRHLRAGS